MDTQSYYSPVISQQTYNPPTETENEPLENKDKKKRTRNPENWKKEKRKRAILSGQEYVNTKGDVVGPRAIGPDCNCKHKCFSAVSVEVRTTIFSGYYSLKSYDEQNAYLYGLIRRYDIQRKRKPVSERRTCSYKYYVRIKGRETQVCKKAFANIHGISDKKIRTLCIKHEQNILFPRDNRGRHNNRPKKVTPELVTLIKHHILRMLSGGSGSDFIKTDKNQGPDVNISSLHKNYLQEYEPEAVDSQTGKVRKNHDCKVKSWLYFKVFHEEFNSIDFHTVKRKLSDLRKSLEAAGAIQAKKKMPKTSKAPKKTPVLLKDPTPIQPPAPIYPQQHFPASMNGGQNGFMAPHEYVLNGSAEAPLNLHQGSHVPSYYLCLGHMSNLISLSPGAHPGPSHAFHHAPQQQFTQQTTLMHPHNSAPILPHTQQGHMPQTYHNIPHNHMY